MTNKKTIKDYLNELLNDYPLSAEHREFIEGRIAAADKKSTTRKPTASQIKNKAVADEVLEFMRSSGLKLSVSDMLKKVPAFASIPDVTSQYANHIVKTLKDNGTLTRVEEKGKALFFATPIDEVEGE